jgi:hypothetical protein
MLLTEKYKEDIVGILSCYDRVIINGIAGTFGYAGGMTNFFYANSFRIFDFAKIFTPVTEKIKENAEKIAKENNIEIEYIRKNGVFRKDEKIAEIIEKKGISEGLVHIFSVLEMSDTYSSWHDKSTGKTAFRNDKIKCLHYYFYFIDKVFGLCFFKVPTISPFKVQFYMNGHNWLEYKLRKENIEYKKIDNAFVEIGNFERGQELSDKLRIEDLHTALDIFTKRYCPIPTEWNQTFSFTIHQVEYALDIVFKDFKTLKPIYENIIKTAMYTVTPDDIANFLGKRFSVLFEGEAGSRYNKRILGTRIKHQMGEISVKIYDKFGRIIRIEVTSNNVSQLKIFRDVKKRDGTVVQEIAPVRKSIYSLFPLITVFKNACNRYLEFISAFDDPTNGLKKLDKVIENATQNNKNYKGFNFFDKDDEKILVSVADGKFTLKGITNKELKKLLPDKKPWQLSRILKRLRLHGLIKKVGNSYKYYLSALGKQVIIAGLSFKNMHLIPDLSTNF